MRSRLGRSPFSELLSSASSSLNLENPRSAGQRGLTDGELALADAAAAALLRHVLREDPRLLQAVLAHGFAAELAAGQELLTRK